MGLFSKKEKVPELPALPTVPEMKVTERKPTDLPILNEPPKDNFEKNLAKYSFENLNSSERNDGDIEASIGLAYNESKQISKPDFSKFERLEKPEMRESVLPDLPKQNYRVSIEKPVKEEIAKKEVSETIFVRIDKFQLAKKELTEVNKLVENAHETISKINGIKLQEDEELVAINADLESLKAKLGEIDEYVFNRV
jgi:hypothetical protein